MTKKNTTVQSKERMEARPLAMLVQIASQYTSTVYLEVEDKHINAKSIMGMMSLTLEEGTKVTIVADGEDEEKAISAIEEFLKGNN